MNNFDIMITHAERNGKIVSINNVPSGKNCNCICTKCKQPLVAKKGYIKEHHFAHLADSECSGETIYHIEAKEQICRDKFIWLPAIKLLSWEDTDYYENVFQYFTWQYELQKVEFETVEKEKQIGKSRFVADLLCTHANGKQLIVEIAYSHFLEYKKIQYLQENKIPTVEIDLRYDKTSGIYWEMGKESLSEYMRCEYFNNITRWVYNEKEKGELPDPKLLEIGKHQPDANPYIIGENRIPVIYN